MAKSFKISQKMNVATNPLRKSLNKKEIKKNEQTKNLIPAEHQGTNECMHNTTNLWRITEPSIKNGRKSECSHAHDIDSRHTHLVKNEYQTMKSTTSAH